jgi:predicted neutral ceramidase superfamily lipid hydrolase
MPRMGKGITMIQDKLRALAAAFVVRADRMPSAFVLIAISMVLANLAVAAEMHVHFLVALFLIIDAALFMVAAVVQMRNPAGMHRWTKINFGMVMIAAAAIFGTRLLAHLGGYDFSIMSALTQGTFLSTSAYIALRPRNKEA